MANIKQAIKRVGVNQKKRAENTDFKSEMRTHIKEVERLIAANEAEKAKAALPTTFKKIDKAVQKGGVHKNNGNRQKSRLSKLVNELSA
ncbi:30S ribosomal protein S20 [Lentibacillus cibarius]|uniref:Small ribosomal subunit protein bS20 n=1 Tax=Lentibacillus cibarius TaxID=2583219 RepID=A0A549YLJ5_9BACI|nr:30S ribosomal protein S20 [Lentibacillus cibarius]TRM12758.1 30S ribosomal protein S20 [Lentibacillus cibarius]